MPRFRATTDSFGHASFVPIDADGEQFIKRRLGRGEFTLYEDGHSLPEHGLLFDYINWAWKTYYQEQHPDREAFRDWVSVMCGHYREVRVRIPSGTEVVDVSFIKIKSWSFGRSHWDEFNALTKRVEEMITGDTGIDMETFKKNKDAEA